MKYINLFQGGHRETYDQEIKNLSSKVNIIFMPKNFTNFLKLILDKELIFFSCCSDGRFYILLASFFRVLLNNKTKVLDFTIFAEISFKHLIYKVYIFTLNKFVTLISVSAVNSPDKNSLVDLCFLNLSESITKKLSYDVGYFGSISDDKNFDGFLKALNDNIFQKAIICSYNFEHEKISKLVDKSKVKIIDKTLDFKNLIDKISQTEYVWTAYNYNQTSGIFGICYQLNSKVIIKKGKYLEKLNYKNSYYIDKRQIYKSSNDKNQFYLNTENELRKWNDIFN